MSITLSIAVFFTVWWVVLFTVLPFGVRSQHEEGNVQPGHDPGAPVAPMLLKKALWTTLLTVVIFSAFYIYVERMS